MPNRNIFTKFALFLSWCIFLSSGASAQEPNYQRIIVDNRVSIEVPSHWIILGLDQRKDISAAAYAMLSGGNGSSAQHIASLAVSSTPAPPGAIIRVSVLPIEVYTQHELNVDIDKNRNEAIQGFREIFKAKMITMDQQMRAYGMKLIGKESVDIEKVGRLTAISLKYRRSPAPGTGSSPFSVTQYHIPIGGQKVLVTLSFRESNRLIYESIIKYVKGSIKVL